MSVCAEQLILLYNYLQTKIVKNIINKYLYYARLFKLLMIFKKD